MDDDDTEGSKRTWQRGSIVFFPIAPYGKVTLNRNTVASFHCCIQQFAIHLKLGSKLEAKATLVAFRIINKQAAKLASPRNPCRFLFL
jgi:hypothetical protein